MNNDLISREALLFEIRQQLAFQKEKAKLTTINADKMAHNMVATGIQLAIDIIDNAPTVNAVFTTKDIEEAYIRGKSYGMGQNIRPQGEWIYKQVAGGICNEYPYCSVCKAVNDSADNFCPNCGADMRGENNGK